MKSARYILTAVLAACICSLSGCSTLDQIIGQQNEEWKEWKPDSNCIEVHGSGKVSEIIFDKLDQTWYAGNELQDMIARSMNEYNATHDSDSINVSSYSDSEGIVKVTIDYKTGADYAQYNNTVFGCGSMLDAQMQGFLFQGPFYPVDGVTISEQAVDPSEPLSHKEYSAVISDGTHVIKVPGEIRYVTGNVSIINSHVASPAGTDAAQQADAMQQAGALSPDQGLSQEEIEQSCLYVIYEKDEEVYEEESSQT